MKRIFTSLLLLLLLLPLRAQKPFTARIIAGKDYPYYINSVEARITTFLEGEKHTAGQDERISLKKLDNRTYSLSYDAPQNTRAFFNLVVTDQQGKSRIINNFLSVPVIPGENLVATLHDEWITEIGGSQLYREYGKAWDAICQQGTPPREYVAQHRKERGCAMFVMSSSVAGMFDELGEANKRYELFDPAAVSFFGDPTDRNVWRDISCSKFYEEERKMDYILDDIKFNIKPFDRQLEGQAIIDAIGRQHKGEPTLVTISTYDNRKPDDYELYLHAHGMKQVHLTSIDESSSERYWKSNVWRYEGDHHLLMRYQVDSLFQLYMPGMEYPRNVSRHFCILLDDEGRVVAHGDRRHGYRQLIDQVDQLKAKAGLPAFKQKPYPMKPLDMDTANLFVEQKRKIFEEAKMRMTFKKQIIVEGLSWKPYADTLCDATAKQLNISQRLYDAVSRYMNKEIKDRIAALQRSSMEAEAEKLRKKTDYKPDLEPISQKMVVGRAIDLGLSVRWADMNVGAKSPEDFGFYFTWGDPEPLPENSVRGWHNYRWSNGDGTVMNKYNTKVEQGAVDMRTTIQPDDDAAAQLWQGDWRTPSREEMVELKEKCKWEWTVQNNVQGYKVTGPNGNSIFLPAAGCLNYLGKYGQYEKGYYWTADISPDSPKDAWYMVFSRDDINPDYLMDRFAGRCIRPVCK